MSSSINLGSSIRLPLATYDATGAAAAPDVGPVVTLYQNGTAMAYVPTVSGATVGLYQVLIDFTTANLFAAGDLVFAYVDWTKDAVLYREAIDAWEIVDPAAALANIDNLLSRRHGQGAWGGKYPVNYAEAANIFPWGPNGVTSWWASYKPDGTAPLTPQSDGLLNTDTALAFPLGGDFSLATTGPVELLKGPLGGNDLAARPYVFISVPEVGPPVVNTGGYVAADATIFEAATFDFLLRMTFKLEMTIAGSIDFFIKTDSGVTVQLVVIKDDALYLRVDDGTTEVSTSIPYASIPVQEWCGLIAVAERSNQALRVGLRSAQTGVSVLSTAADITAVGDLTNAGVAKILYNTDNNFIMSSGWEIATGELVGSNVSANMDEALRMYMNALNLPFDTTNIDIPEGTAPSAAAVADAVWDEARSGHVTAGTFGAGVVVASIVNDAIAAAAIATDAVDKIRDGILTYAIETGVTIKQAVRGILAVTTGKQVDEMLRAHDDDVVFYAPDGTTPRLTATIIAGIKSIVRSFGS